jgi:putative oxidoreductase
MTPLFALYDRLTDQIANLARPLLPSFARFAFAAVLLGYFWNSALTKLGDGLFSPSSGAYIQIFPRVFEAAGYDADKLSLWQHLVVLAGTYAEFVLPLLIVIGLFTRLAAIGMVGFIIVQSLTDYIGHKADPVTLGAWFDAASDSLILDQRALWMLPLLVLAILGAGPLSLDHLACRMRAKAPN